MVAIRGQEQRVENKGSGAAAAGHLIMSASVAGVSQSAIAQRWGKGGGMNATSPAVVRGWGQEKRSARVWG